MPLKAVIYNSFASAWVRFENPSEVIQTSKLDAVVSLLEYVNRCAVEFKKYAVGFIPYDASPAFDSAMTVKENAKSELPLLWFALFDDYKAIEIPRTTTANNYFSDWTPSVSETQYNSSIAKIKDYIKAGDTYQVNYTLRQHASFKGEPWELFCELANSQRSRNCAFIETDDFAICSASPELFFTLKDGLITSKPMKGTTQRGLTLAEDKKQAEWLHNSRKNRSENIMIVDMIRNDIGRIAQAGTVKIPKVFEVEKYPTVWQMTSTVHAKTNKSVPDIMKALFPCASITGAPKVRTMVIISELEATPRGIYTGSIGFIAPDNSAQFNVAIRTVVINKKTSVAEYGVGGGIVWDSTNSDEYNECLIKTKFLSNPIPDFSILESILWTPDNGYFLLEYHLERMRKSAEYFDYPFDAEKIKLLLNKEVTQPSEPLKVRLLLNIEGKVSVERSKLGQFKNTISVAISGVPVRKNNPFLCHKTTNRKLYEDIKSKHSSYDEVILWNEDGEVTEAITSNIVIKIGANLYTPPISCGLLGGTFRQYLLDKGEIAEKIIKLDELKSSDEIYFINSIRKFRLAVIDWALQ
ncbi:MAG: aminodeoxychorismate synthase component I [Lentisphaerota bacterium]